MRPAVQLATVGPGAERFVRSHYNISPVAPNSFSAIKIRRRRSALFWRCAASGSARHVIVGAADGRRLQRVTETPTSIIHARPDLPDRDSALLTELAPAYPRSRSCPLGAQRAGDNVVGRSVSFPRTPREVMLARCRLCPAASTFRPDSARNGHRHASPRSRRPASDLGLTARQIEVLALMMQGKSNKGSAGPWSWPSRP